jgi:hypothetical protein
MSAYDSPTSAAKVNLSSTLVQLAVHLYWFHLIYMIKTVGSTPQVWATEEAGLGGSGVGLGDDFRQNVRRWATAR